MNFLLIDELLELERGKRALCRKLVREDEPFFEDHFPGFPIVPGVFLIEAMAQAGGWVLAHDHDFERYSLLGTVDHAKFRVLVRPGDELRIETELKTKGAHSARTRARIHVGGKLVASADLTHLLRSFESDPSGESIDREWFLGIWRQIGGPKLNSGNEVTW